MKKIDHFTFKSGIAIFQLLSFRMQLEFPDLEH